ncbi:MAG: phytoene/squalene synthase family protein [Dehalococcoidia bacterium]
MPSQPLSLESFPGRQHSLEASYANCREVMRRHSKSFYFAARLLPSGKRRAAQALYGFFRELDDLVDCRGIEISAAQAHARLAAWKDWLVGGCPRLNDHPLAPALVDTLERFQVPRNYLLQLADGIEADLGDVRYETFAELTGYCFNVASTVGLTLCAVLGTSSEQAPARAAELGVAMQLTNILRDVAEDHRLGRVYLPREDMARAGYSMEKLALGTVDASFCRLMAELIARARLYYDCGLSGVEMLDGDSRFAIAVAGRSYAAILNKIEQRGYDVFSGRAHVSFREKLGLAAALLVHVDRLPAHAESLPPHWPSGTTLLAGMTGANYRPDVP